MKCPNCGAACEREAKYCAYCGTPLDFSARAEKQIHIHYHQEQRQPDAPVRVETVYVPTERKSDRSRGIALVLCFFFGFFGVHRFYLGKIGTGVLYLLSYGLFGFGWLVDLFSLLIGNPKDRQGLPVKWS